MKSEFKLIWDKQRKVMTETFHVRAELVSTINLHSPSRHWSTGDLINKLVI